MRNMLLISALAAASAFGQTGVPGQKTVVVQMGDAAEFGPVGITTALAGPMEGVAGAPYSARVTTERVQVLADGNRIEQTTSGSIARDGQGRIRRDEALPGLKSDSGDAPHIVMIDDPVARVHWTLDAQTKTAMKIAMPAGKDAGIGPLGVPLPPPAGAKTFFYSSGLPPVPPAKNQVFIRSGSNSSNDLNVTKTDLGMQKFETVQAQGTRITRTIPAGQIGNEQPIAITTETWYSPDLKVLVMSKSNDPRMGETTYKLTDIQRSEPAAGLFQPPDDYTIKDQPANRFIYHEEKKN